MTGDRGRSPRYACHRLWQFHDIHSLFSHLGDGDGNTGLSGVSGGRGRECVRVPRDVLESYILSAHHVLGRVISMAGLAQ